jgi:hypothetical protein
MRVPTTSGESFVSARTLGPTGLPSTKTCNSPAVMNDQNVCVDYSSDPNNCGGNGLLHAKFVCAGTDQAGKGSLLLRPSALEADAGLPAYCVDSVCQTWSVLAYAILACAEMRRAQL